MNRRNFLKNTSTAGITLATASLGIYNEALAAPANEAFADFDLNEKNFDGIDLIAKVTPELGVYQSFLITSTYDDPKLIRRASEAGVRVIPKSRLFEYAIELH